MSRAIFKLGLGGRTLIKSVSFIGTNYNTAGQSSYTFSSQSVGAAPAAGERRFIALSFGAYISSVRPLTGITMDGAAMTVGVVATSSGTYVQAGTYYLESNTGTTKNFVLTFSGSMNDCGIGVHRIITGPNGLHVLDTATAGTDTHSLTVNTKVGGAVIGAAFGYDGTGAPAWGGTGPTLTEDWNFDGSGGNEWFTGASRLMVTAGSENWTCNFGGTPDASAGSMLSLAAGPA